MNSLFVFYCQDYCDGGTLDDRIHEATLVSLVAAANGTNEPWNNLL